MPVSLSEDLDSVAAVTHLGLDRPGGLRAGLAATLVKRQSHRPNFDAIFDLFFPRVLGAGAAERRRDRRGRARTGAPRRPRTSSSPSSATS